MLGRSWVEIDIGQLKKNYLIYKGLLKRGQDIIAVVKADAYGHGDAETALALQEIGAMHFAVSNIEEAKKLREAGIVGTILILGYTPLALFEELIEYDIIQTLVSEEYAKQASETGLPIKAQFAVDTGMNRIGLDGDDADKCVEIIEHYSKKMNLVGIFTHLAAADENDEFTTVQIEKFHEITKRVAHLKLPFVHCLNSAGGMWHNQGTTAFVRLGITLYGLTPNYEKALPNGIKPILTWKSVISMVKTITSGEFVGYGLSYKSEKNRKIATIPTGYADGYSRMLSNKGSVFIKGKRAPIVGKVCMDQFMVDVSDIDDVCLGDEVVLIGDGYSADDIANEIGTIGYEVTCNISKRVPRIFK